MKLADFLHVAIFSWVPWGFWCFWRSTEYACMHACSCMHACKFQKGSSTRYFLNVILELHAKNQVSTIILHNPIKILCYAAGLYCCWKIPNPYFLGDSLKSYELAVNKVSKIWKVENKKDSIVVIITLTFMIKGVYRLINLQ